MNKNAKIYIPGHLGLVGSALLKKLEQLNYENLVVKTRLELDLTRQKDVTAFFEKERPQYIFLCAAKVGGIKANMNYPAEFITENLLIQNHIIHNAYRFSVKKLLFLGSSCIYPKNAPQPIKESYLLTGPLEPSNAPYAIAKIAGITQCKAYNSQYGTQFMAVMPTNLYGPNDRFDLEKAHVIPALIRKFHLAKLIHSGNINAIKADEKKFGNIPDSIKKTLLEMGGNQVGIWGTGTPMREFLYADDLATALLHLMRLSFDRLSHPADPHDDKAAFFPQLFNVGWEKEISIKALALLIKDIVGYKGEVVFEKDKPDGTPQKRLDISKISSLDWQPVISLKEGIKRTYDWYLQSS